MKDVVTQTPTKTHTGVKVDVEKVANKLDNVVRSVLEAFNESVANSETYEEWREANSWIDDVVEQIYYEALYVVNKEHNAYDNALKDMREKLSEVGLRAEVNVDLLAKTITMYIVDNESGRIIGKDTINVTELYDYQELINFVDNLYWDVANNDFDEFKFASELYKHINAIIQEIIRKQREFVEKAVEVAELD